MSHQVIRIKYFKAIYFGLTMLLSSICFAQSNKTDTLRFSTKLWQQDTLGKYGYRKQFVFTAYLVDQFSRKRPKDIDALLGDPDFICEDAPNPGYMAYIYVYECSTPICTDSTFKYQSKQSRDKFINFGPALMIYFDKKHKVLDFDYWRPQYD